MAIIQCPECGKDISDKARKCVYCGKVFIEDNIDNRVICSECGAVLSETDEICNNCGCPVEKEINEDGKKTQQVEVSSIKKANKTKKIIIGLAIVVIFCAVGGVGYKIYSDYMEEQNYIESYNEYIYNLIQAQILMLADGSDAESLCNLTLKVWGNAISKDSDYETDKYTKPNGYFVSDFNEALINLYADSSTKTKISNIQSNQATVKELIKKLQSPPEGLENCYESVSDLYEAYKKLTDLAINPTGSYAGFGEEKRDVVSDFMAAYEKLDNQIPDEIETN